MSRPCFLAFALLALAVAGCDFGARAERLRAEREREQAEAHRAEAEEKQKSAEAGRQIINEDIARRQGKVIDSFNQLNKNALPGGQVVQTGDFSPVTGTGTFVISYPFPYTSPPELTFPTPVLHGLEFITYSVTDRRPNGFTIKVEQCAPDGDAFAATVKKFKWVAKGNLERRD